MNIAFFCKQHYTGRDVIHERYGRLYEIPRQLAKLGHSVRVYCLDYHGMSRGRWSHDAEPGTLQLEVYPIGRSCFPALLGYPKHLLNRLREFKPDLLIGASDIPHAGLVAWLAKCMKVPYVVDLYDNFESFGQARVPGFITILRRAVKGASLVTVVSAPLKDMVMQKYAPSCSVIVIENAIDRSVFKPADKVLARQHLNLPCDAVLMGSAGGLSRPKGLATLYAAWSEIEKAYPNVHLVLAGPQERGFLPPKGARVHYLGHLPHEQVAELFCALDIGVVTVSDSSFGRYCFPQKAYEMLACKLRVVAADVGVMSVLFSDTPRLLYSAEDAKSLVEAIANQIERPIETNVQIVDWQQLISYLELDLNKLVYS